MSDENTQSEGSEEGSTMERQKRINRIREDNQKRMIAKQERNRQEQIRNNRFRNRKKSNLLIKALIGGSATGFIGGGTWFIFS